MKRIESVHNPLVKHWMQLQNEKAYRNQKKTALVEGKNLIRDLLNARKVSVLITQEEGDFDVDEHIVISKKILDKITGVENPEGWLAEVPIQPISPLPPIRRLLVLEELQDPGNVGTLLRTAKGLGWDGVFFLGPCCDPWNAKAVRAAKGATFFLPIAFGEWPQLDDFLEKNELHLIGADLHGESLEHIIPPEQLALVLGNEARGLSPTAKQRCHTITIPLLSHIESLNVASAGSILLYTLRRQA